MTAAQHRARKAHRREVRQVIGELRHDTLRHARRVGPEALRAVHEGLRRLEAWLLRLDTIRPGALAAG